MKRPPIPPKLRAAAMAKNNGICTWAGCDKPGTICEHLDAWFFVQEHKLENLEPRCNDHAKEKTREDIRRIRKTTRMAGGYGSQYARRKRNGSKLKSNPKIQSPQNYKWPERKFETKKKVEKHVRSF